ncbi:DUF1275 domain-containing protein [Paenibacillus doosanensis]|nr:YoaK family protein [Paenibacillus konkukensis]MCS7462297.1 DUF1275 domain-containing protein [Paenibacillus doosanensis]
MIILLCLTSGIVDVIGYLSLGHVFTANMTGNIVLLGLAIGHEEGFAVLRSLAALLGFIAGTAAAAVIVGRNKTKSFWPREVTLALGIEGLILLGFALLSRAEASDTMVYALIILLSVAMGMQTTAARRLGIAGISTTVLTNNLANVVEDVMSKARAWLRKDKASGFSLDSALRLLAIVIYGLGAIVGSIAETSHPLAIIWVPILIVAGIVAVSASLFRSAETSS